MKTNIGKVFFKLLHKHFLKTHKFHKIFSKNTVKLSYSRMRNMASIYISIYMYIYKSKQKNSNLRNIVKDRNIIGRFHTSILPEDSPHDDVKVSIFK